MSDLKLITELSSAFAHIKAMTYKQRRFNCTSLKSMCSHLAPVAYLLYYANNKALLCLNNMLYYANNMLYYDLNKALKHPDPRFPYF